MSGTVDEPRALARLGFAELGRATSGIERVHRAISDRAFGAVGPVARGAKLMHDGISGVVYGSVRGGMSAAGVAADQALALRPAPEDRELSTSSRGSGLLAVINGLIGDVLEREGSELQEPMAVRVDGHVVAPERDALRTAFRAPTSRLVVFVHGLMETEFAWRLGAGRQEGETYGTRLARDLGCTPVYVRYNTGRHISENGRSLADLLEQVVEAWPVEVAEIDLVGHSMGGLVARSACYRAAGDEMGWVRLVRHVVSLGSPHMGAPLEQIVHVASAALSIAPETRPFGSFLRRRSGGIRDLRRGSLVDEDWRDCDPDALRAAACKEVPLLEGATHCFVAGTVTRSPRHPLGRIVGDWLVLLPSASGRSRSRRIPFKTEHGLHVGGTNHLALLNHPDVYVRLREWLATPPERVAAVTSRAAC
jgi:pimeloyl-ACP methyl ester carboxylesterase